MKKIITFCMVLILSLTFVFSGVSFASENIKPDTWSYVDGLGRVEDTFGEIPQKRTDHQRVVGIFYHTWHTEFATKRVPVNVNSVIEQYPEAAIDVKYNDFWKNKYETTYTPGYFWNEPVFGYYNTIDEYVLRKHAEMLADAGVDFIFIDGTNGQYLWEAGVNALLKVFGEAREDGVDAPQIVFWLSLSEVENRVSQLKKIYQLWYSKSKYDDLWFKWEGKPLVLCFEDVKEQKFKDSDEIINAFTFRPINPSYFNHGGSDKNYWGWLSVYPQCKYGTTPDGRPEQMAVGIAQNALSTSYRLTYMAAGSDVMGRSYASRDTETLEEYSYSYTYGGKEYVVDQRNDFATLAGRNFQQQWDYAIQNDPDVVLVTGWNEWTAYRESGFCDAFTDEYSRDIEPTKGELKDYYYYQLVANIRRYKGVDKADWNDGDKKTIDIFSDDLTQWDSLTSYDHYTGSTRDRDCVGYKTCKFENFTLRNDFVTSKVAYDDNNFYFYVSTKDDISSETDKSWMRLFIDTDYTGNSQNWEGFEYVINRVNPQNGTCTLERSAGVGEDGMWAWETVSGDIKYSVKGNVLQLEVPKASLGFGSGSFDFSFKWSDNMQVEGDIMDFYTNGDVAPGGRFCFRFQNKVNLTAKDASNTWLIVACIVAVVLAVVAVIAVIIVSKKGKKSSNAVEPVSESNETENAQ